MIFLIELDGNMLQICGAFRAQVHDDVQNSAPRAADELRFGRRRVLEMHTADTSFLASRCHVDLGNECLQPMSLELILAKSSCKKSSPVLPALQLDNEGSFQFGLGEN